jgi:hypothetical protein
LQRCANPTVARAVDVKIQQQDKMIFQLLCRCKIKILGLLSEKQAALSGGG